MSIIKRIIFIISLCTFNQFILAQEFWEREHLSGNWYGIRKVISEKGIDFSANYTGDVFSNIYGGLKNGSAYLDNIDLTLSIDTDKLFYWHGGLFFFYGLGNHGKNPSLFSGDIQGVDNIAAFSTWKLYEAWFQQNLLNNRLSILAGIYDLNSEFQVLESSGLFINSSNGIGIEFSQSGRNGPSIFPYTTLALRIKWSFTDRLYLQSAVFNGTAGNPDDPYGTKIIFTDNSGILSVTEFQTYLDNSTENTNQEEKRPKNRLGRFDEIDYKAKLSAGFWIYTAEFPEISAYASEINFIRGNYGLYFCGEYSISNKGGIKDKGLSVFARIGFANARINRFLAFTGFGAVYIGIIPGREYDALGLAFAGAYNGSEYISVQKSNRLDEKKSEWNIELTYSFFAATWFNIQPDIQYIINPNTSSDIKNSFAAGLRMSLDL